MSDFTAERINAARGRTDIVSLIRNHVALVSHGPRSFRGCCPLHYDGLGSFYVHPHSQMFHCFACKTSGDAIAFLMNVCEWSIGEAVEALEAMPATREAAESRPWAGPPPIPPLVAEEAQLLGRDIQEALRVGDYDRAEALMRDRTALIAGAAGSS